MTRNSGMPKQRKISVQKKNGASLAPWDGHPTYKWRVTFPDGNTRKTKGFKTKSGEDGAKAFFDRKAGVIAEDGNRHESITDSERRAVLEFREMISALPNTVSPPTLSEAISLMKETLKVRHKSKTILELIDLNLRHLEREGVSKKHLITITQRLSRFAEDYGDWLACELSEEIAGDWLDELELAPLTTNHYRAALIQLFNRALEKGAIEKNPFLSIPKRKVKKPEVGILKPHEVAKLLEFAPKEILAGLAIGFFAGVRRAELGRLDWSEINFDEDLIDIKADKAKTAARRLIPIRENLRAWLLPLQQTSGPVMPTEQIWRSRRDVAMSKAEILSWPANAPRHSFATYHLAHFKDAPALALEMGHTTTKMIFEHYRAIVTPKSGQKFWEIQPAQEGKIIDIAL